MPPKPHNNYNTPEEYTHILYIYIYLYLYIYIFSFKKIDSVLSRLILFEAQPAVTNGDGVEACSVSALTGVIFAQNEMGDETSTTLRRVAFGLAILAQLYLYYIYII